MRFLLLIESNTTGTGRLFTQNARRLGLRPLLITNDPARYSYAASDAIDVMKIETADHDTLGNAVCAFAAENDVAGIYSSSEYWIESSANLACRLCLFGPNPQAIRVCRNKRKQRELFQRFLLPTPQFRSITSVDQLKQALTALSLPLVVKPIQGSGSVGVKLCRTTTEVLEQACDLLSQKVNERGLPIPREILIEEYLQGNEYSVEVFSNEIVGITRKYLSPEPHFVEIGHDFPAQVSDETEGAIRQMAMQALSVVGLSWGPAHIEIRMTERGPVVVEINPRLAGGFIPELVRQSTGIDLIDCTIRAVTGEEAPLRRRSSKHASIRFLMSERNGMLGAMRGTEDAALVESITSIKIYKSPGDFVVCRGDFRDRLGHVIACDESAESAMFSAQRAKEMLVPEIA